jgi:hypothetical protein
LERRGYAVWRVRGYSAIDAARNRMAGDALAQGFDALMWIDGDIVFAADDVDKLRRHNLPLVCGIYPKKARREFACAFLPQTRQVRFGVAGGLLEILCWKSSTAVSASSIRSASFMRPCNGKITGTIAGMVGGAIGKFGH